MVPQYSIFCGRFRDKDAQWVENVQGPGAAYERMKEIASQLPGPYFIFSARSREALASIDTSRKHNQNAAAG
jgi:hypothetical protein